MSIPRLDIQLRRHAEVGTRHGDGRELRGEDPHEARARRVVPRLRLRLRQRRRARAARDAWRPAAAPRAVVRTRGQSAGHGLRGTARVHCGLQLEVPDGEHMRTVPHSDGAQGLPGTHEGRAGGSSHRRVGRREDSHAALRGAPPNGLRGGAVPPAGLHGPNRLCQSLPVHADQRDMGLLVVDAHIPAWRGPHADRARLLLSARDHAAGPLPLRAGEVPRPLAHRRLRGQRDLAEPTAGQPIALPQARQVPSARVWHAQLQQLGAVQDAGWRPTLGPWSAHHHGRQGLVQRRQAPAKDHRGGRGGAEAQGGLGRLTVQWPAAERSPGLT
mmetsp:Transcript_35853/g.92254  ORF Transcript_35853/g.92254 Transcript_35853/m.92254 type:complete len:329 (+) Transcript_35853:569-1555(+)